MLQNEAIKEALQTAEDTENKQLGLLRLLTCGSVDDGKSTLIGRLLHDTHQILDDQLASLESASKKQGTTGEKLDLALLVDGLQAEREQGITIDVAYRYFASQKRKFIIADTPGHEQYTRNMATGASNCDLAIILIDARKGVLTQTRRHSYIASLLGIKRFIVAVNKMDLIDYSQPTFEAIKQHYLDFAKQLTEQNPDLQIDFIPLCALEGDNVVEKTENLNWYEGPALLDYLEQVEINSNKQEQAMRLPVQYVNRPNLDFRGYCGTLLSGTVSVGDSVIALPSGKSSTVKSIVTFDGNLKEAVAGQAITVTLNDEIDISRGDMLVKANELPQQSQNITATLVWMNQQALNTETNKEYEFKFSSSTTRGRIKSINFKTDVNTLAQQSSSSLELNEIGECQLRLNQEIAFDLYKELPKTGSFIVIDRLSNNTVAAGMINGSWQQDSQALPDNISAFELEFNALVRKHFPHWQAIDLSAKG